MPYKELSRGKDVGIDDAVTLDIHAIKHLEDIAMPLTDTSLKYNYESDENGNYSKILSIFHDNFFLNSTLINSIKYS